MVVNKIIQNNIRENKYNDKILRNLPTGTDISLYV